MLQPDYAQATPLVLDSPSPEVPAPVVAAEELTSMAAAVGGRPALVPKRVDETSKAMSITGYATALHSRISSVPLRTRTEQALRRIDKRIVAGALATGALCVSGWWYLTRGEVPPPATPVARELQFAPARSAAREIGLEITRKGSDLQIAWNRTSETVRSSRSGTLTIVDGGKRVNVALDNKRLQSGVVLYAPKSNDIEFELLVTTDRGVVSDVLRVIDTASPRPVPYFAAETTAVRSRTESRPPLDLAEKDKSPSEISKGPQASSSAPETLASRQVASEPPRTVVLPSTEKSPSALNSGSDVGKTPPQVQEKALSEPVPAAKTPAPPEQSLVAASSPPTQSIADIAPPQRGLSTTRTIRQPVASPPIPAGKMQVTLPPNIKRMLIKDTTIHLKLRINPAGRVTEVIVPTATGLNAHLAALLPARPSTGGFSRPG